MEPAGGFRDNGELMRNQINTGPNEATGGRLSNARIPIERLKALVKITRMIAEASEQAFFRADEVQRV